MKNIVFIGMPGSGKTTVSRAFANTLGRPWYDTDDMIEALEGTSISQIFAQKGEGYFRALETNCLKTLSSKNGIVFSAGGGAVLKNGALLKNNAIVVYLERSIPDILSTIDHSVRPLAGEPEDLLALYEARHGIYETLCDIRIKNIGSVEETVDNLISAIKALR